MNTFKIGNRTFDCEFVGERPGGVLLYKEPVQDCDHRPYFVAKRDDLLTYSRSSIRAIAHLDHLQFYIDFKKRSLNMREKIDRETFEFMYRRVTSACSDFSANFAADIHTRNVRPDDVFTLQQWACLSHNRFNSWIFLQWLDNIGRNNNKRPPSVWTFHWCPECKRACKLPTRDTGR